MRESKKLNSNKVISGESIAYKRGVVLGLTMAEILLILIFCLAFLGVIALKNFQEAKIQSDAESKDILNQNIQLKSKNVELNNSIASLNNLITSLEQKISNDTEQNEDQQQILLDQISELQSELSEKNKQLEEQAFNIAKRKKNEEETQNTVSILRTEVLSQKKEIKNLEELVIVFEEMVEQLGITPIEDDWVELIDKKEFIETLEEKHDLSHEEIMSILNELNSYLELNDPNLIDTSLTELIELAKLGKNIESTNDEHDWPPFINLSEAEGFSFEVGKATLSASFERDLRGPIADRILLDAAKYNAKIVEVVGHTDEQPIRRGSTNLDGKIIDALSGKISVNELSPGDNAGLGIARAVSVANVLRGLEQLTHLTVLPLSGGQLIIPVDQVTDGNQPGDVKERRRIEIRVRRSQQTTNISN